MITKSPSESISTASEKPVWATFFPALFSLILLRLRDVSMAIESANVRFSCYFVFKPESVAQNSITNNDFFSKFVV